MRTQATLGMLMSGVEDTVVLQSIYDQDAVRVWHSTSDGTGDNKQGIIRYTLTLK